MLLLQRHEGETIHIGDAITVQVKSIVGRRVTLSFDAPRDVLILRGELREREDEFARVAASSACPACGSRGPCADPQACGSTVITAEQAVDVGAIREVAKDIHRCAGNNNAAFHHSWADKLTRAIGNAQADGRRDCSGAPASCPENEGYGCCKANPTPPQPEE